MSQVDISVVFVSYNGREVFDVALEALYKSQTSYNYEVIIIDNASPDDSNEMIRQKYLSQPEIAAKTTLIENGRNDRFAKGNNIGMAKAKGDYILLLNTDTKIAPENIQVMLDFMKSRPDVGIATCKLVMANGEIDKASRRSEPNMMRSFFRLFGFQKLFPKWFGGYNMLNKDPNQESELEACSGAYLLMSRAVYEKTQGFDERFSFYGEDLDLCRTAREAGFKVWWYPKTTCVHYRGQSAKKEPRRNLYAFHEAMWIYYKKWYSKQYLHLTDPLVYIGAWGLFYWKLFLNTLKKP